jgi:hypothetical protein
MRPSLSKEKSQGSKRREEKEWGGEEKLEFAEDSLANLS